jgi:hypothetical protein
MNSQLFKKLIKEAVREAVREELKQLLAEHAASQLMQPNSILRENLEFSSGDVGPNRYPKTPQQLAAEKAKMEAMFGDMRKAGPKLSSLEPDLGGKPAIAGGGNFNAFLQDTAANFNPAEMMGGE